MAYFIKATQVFKCNRYKFPLNNQLTSSETKIHFMKFFRDDDDTVEFIFNISKGKYHHCDIYDFPAFHSCKKQLEERQRDIVVVVGISRFQIHVLYTTTSIASSEQKERKTHEAHL